MVWNKSLINLGKSFSSYSSSNETPNIISMGEMLSKVSEVLKKVESVITPRFEASTLMGIALGKDRQEIVTNQKSLLSHEQIKSIEKLVQVRKVETPMAYIRGYQEFWSLPFKVNENTLIPRPATETVVSQAIHLINSDENLKNGGNILDLGTGSGCIIISIMKEIINQNLKLNLNSSKIVPQNWKGVAVDIEPKTLEVAKYNSIHLGIPQDLITFVVSNWTKNLIQLGIVNKFDLIISNPPYLTSYDWENVPKTISDYEPHVAFYGGQDGLDSYRQLALQIPDFITNVGYLILEIGSWQESNIRKVFEHKFECVKSIKDDEGHMRCLVFKKK